MKLNIIVLLSLVLLAGCGKEQKVSLPEVPQASYSMKAGPLGEKPVTVETLFEQIQNSSIDNEKLQGRSVAIAMHDVNNRWSQALLNGMKETLKQYSISVEIITDGEFDVSKQVADIENIISLKPDLMITLPLDAELCSEPLKKASQQGITQVFIDAVPRNFTVNDFAGFAVGDAYQMGRFSAETLAEQFRNPTEIAMLTWKNSMFTVDQRTDGAREYFDSSPLCSVAVELSFTEFYEIPSLVDSLIKNYPNVKGLWTVWDTPAFEAINEIKRQKSPIVVSTCDLSKEVAEALVNDSVLVGTGVDHPYLQGVAEALLAVAALNDLKVPSFTTIYAEKVTAANINEAWQRLYNEPLNSESGIQ